MAACAIAYQEMLERSQRGFLTAAFVLDDEDRLIVAWLRLAPDSIGWDRDWRRRLVLTLMLIAEFRKANA